MFTCWCDLLQPYCEYRDQHTKGLYIYNPAVKTLSDPMLQTPLVPSSGRMFNVCLSMQWRRTMTWHSETFSFISLLAIWPFWVMSSVLKNSARPFSTTSSSRPLPGQWRSLDFAFLPFFLYTFIALICSGDSSQASQSVVSVWTM